MYCVRETDRQTDMNKIVSVPCENPKPSENAQRTFLSNSSKTETRLAITNVVLRKFHPKRTNRRQVF